MSGKTLPDTHVGPAGAAFSRAVARFDPGKPVLILTHNDADGLAAGALLQRTFDRTARRAQTRVLGRGENAWSAEHRADLARADLGGLIVSDLGVREGALKPGTPTVVIDHHVPVGTPGDATVISGHGDEPIPTSSLLAWRCAGVLAQDRGKDVSDLLWLAAVGLVGDLGDKAPFEELAEAKKRFTGTALRELVSLVNAPRRAAAGDAAPALALLLAARDPRDALSGTYPETAALQKAREEVKAAADRGKRVAPVVRGDVALISLHTPCQIHPLVAQAWRTRLKDKIVIAANAGYRPGWVHFAARTATDHDLIAFLRKVAPPGADENYGSGHRQATGGALRSAQWPMFLHNIGFADVPHEAAA